MLVIKDVRIMLIFLSNWYNGSTHEEKKWEIFREFDIKHLLGEFWFHEIF